MLSTAPKNFASRSVFLAQHPFLRLENVSIDVKNTHVGTHRKKSQEAGRKAAALALKDLGSEDLYVGRGLSGEPIWPNGFVGSISHKNDIAVALVAKDSDCHSIGVDIEASKLSSSQVAALLKRCLDDIESLICETSTLPFDLAVALCFSAKESIFKCLFPVHKKHFYFDSMRLMRIEESTQILVFASQENIGPLRPGGLLRCGYEIWPEDRLLTFCIYG